MTGDWQSSETLDNIFGIDESYIRSIEGWKEIVHPDDQNTMDEYLRLEVIGKQKSFNKEYKIKRINDKQTRWVYGIGDVKFDDTGNITEMVGTIQDITERKNAETALRESEETFRRLFNESADSTLLLDDTGFTDCNQSAVSILGYSSRQEVLNKKPWDISPEKQPDGRLSSEKAKEMIAKAVQQGYNRFEWVHIKADGTKFPVEVMLTAITLKGKQSFYTVWRDITERKIAEQSLIDLSNRLLLATNSEGTGIFDWDIQKNILLWDTNMYKIFGVSPDKFNGTFEAWSNTVHPDDLENSLAEVQALINGTKDFHTLFRILWAGTEVRHIEGHAIIMRDGNGKAYRMIGVNRDITEQKKAEEEILKERDLSNSIINNLPGIFYLLDETGNNLRWNKNFETVSGYSAGEISQLHALDSFEADERQVIEEKLEEVFKSGRADVETILLTKTKKKIPYYFNAWRIIFEGKPCLIGVGIDITERKRTEEALRITQFAFDHAGDSIYWMTPDSRIVNVNEAACLTLGYTRQELLELSVPDIDSNYNEEVWSMFFPELREKGSLFFETMQHAKDGRLIPVEIRANYIKFGDQELSCAFVRDITERKKAEQEIIMSEARFKKAQEVAHVGNWELNFTDGNTFVSDEACRIHGIPFGQNKQLPEAWLSFIHPEDLDFVLKNMKEAQDHFSDFTLNYRIKLNDGSIRHIYSETKFQFGSTGKPTGMYGTAQDITERKKTEEKIKKYAEELESSNMDLEQFAYVASHDLQEPLRMVSSFLGLLEKKYKGQLDETAEKYINFAIDGAVRMKILIQDLLMYSRIGNKKDDFTRVDLNEVALFATKVVEEDIKKSQAIITVSPLPVITANNSLISQLFINLITNAIKYRSDTKPEIEVGYSEDKGNYTIFVKDNGIGIDPKFFDKIFVIFQRLHNKDEYSGTGIGLAICKKIAEIHKGKLWVESEAGKGSTFYFSIPKTKQSA
ncbi:MAG: PAS domain S-box protein [Bacteroidota bacterium]|nr:PAS domain S-box protein [Bacteroidota bacterium]